MSSAPFVIAPASSPPVAALDDREEARRQLLAAAVVDADQAATRDRIVTFLDAHDDALHRSCVPGHLTGSGAIVDLGTGRTLLIHHAKLERWLQPGGHADGDGNLGHVAWREAWEETGLDDLRLVTPAIDVDVHEIPARGSDPDHLHLDLRFLVVTEGEPAPVANDEVLGARWMEPDDAAVPAGSELQRLLLRARAVAAEVQLSSNPS
ncbi:MAG: NUDIX domain-containing protein [Actinomycetota bacterium]